MNTSEFSLVPLQQASLCLDCEMITSAHTHCLACGSAALMNLARTLNGGGRAKPMPRGLATVASISARRATQAQAFSSIGSLRQRRPVSKGATFPEAGRGVAAETHVNTNGWRGSLREITAVVQRQCRLSFSEFRFGSVAQAHPDSME